MAQRVDPRWQHALTLEANGDVEAALRAYEQLLGQQPVMALLRMSELEQRSNRYRAALRHAQDASDAIRRNEKWEALPLVTNRLLAFSDRGTIKDLLQAADWSVPAVLRNAAILSQHLWLIDEHAQALTLLDAAKRHGIDNHLCHYSRANALIHCGRLEEATAELEECIRLAPDYAYAHWSLAYHAEADPTRTRVERIRGAMASNAGDVLASAHLAYALFKELDGIDDVDAAWAALDSGMRGMRQVVAHDGQAEALAFSRIKNGFSAPLEKAPARDAGPIFVTGMPRSGTTVLDRMLGNHAEVTSGGELNDFLQAMCWEAGEFFSIPRMLPDAGQLAKFDFGSIGRRYLQTTSARYVTNRLVDKNPLNIFNAGLIAKSLPQARIVCMLRNPMDACFSTLKELFAGGAYSYSYSLADVAAHYGQFAGLVRHWQRMLGDRFMVVGYEALVSDPEATAREVMDFCGLPFQPGLAEITRNESVVSTASSSQVRQAIHTKGVDAWRRYEKFLAPLQAGLLEASQPMKQAESFPCHD